MNVVYGGQLDEDIRVIIDGKTVFCPRNSRILEAANSMFSKRFNSNWYVWSMCS